MIHTNKKMLQFFSTLADETRLKILLSLAEGDKTVNQIHSDVGKDTMTVSAISHQLKQMSDIDVITAVRKGRERIYSLSSNFCWCILRDSFNHFHKETGCPMCKKAKKEGLLRIQH